MSSTFVFRGRSVSSVLSVCICIFLVCFAVSLRSQALLRKNMRICSQYKMTANPSMLGRKSVVSDKLKL